MGITTKDWLSPSNQTVKGKAAWPCMAWFLISLPKPTKIFKMSS